MKVIDLSATNVDLAPAATHDNIPVPVEHWIEVFINEQLAMNLVCTPEHMDELVVGRMYTEGIIRSVEDIELLYICAQGARAKITLKGPAACPGPDKADPVTVPTCCTDNRTFIGSRKRDRALQPIPWDPAWVESLLPLVSQGAPLYSQTHAVHACYLARRGEILCCREDIGRHNALDKVIGWALLQQVDLSQCMLFTTGRMPTDLISKAVQAGVPILVSKTYPTDLGIALAQKSHLTLITIRSAGQMLVWHDESKTPDER